ncbi:MAG: peptide-methionine (S)-S-oxide reductase MsrA [Sphingobacteriales bacterium]|nr:peptide-methionine (S)-S-oxide reductase MsrA [Sphingobacteriales bacterium]
MRILFSFLSFIFFAGCNHAQNAPAESAKDTSSNKKVRTMDTTMEIATFGGGCYWCMEAVFQRLEGVAKVESGFSGGQVKDPTYKEVCTGTTGHAEVIQLTFDTAKVSFTDLLKVFFTMHDPTTLNRQGNDIGTQYRSGIFYHNDAQKKASQEIIDALNQAHAYPDKIVTEVTPFDTFYKAEDYHQDYYNQNKTQGYCMYVIQPKIEKFEKVFKDRLKK